MTLKRSDAVITTYATIEDPRPRPSTAEVFYPAVRYEPARQMNRHERRRAAAMKRRKR